LLLSWVARFANEPEGCDREDEGDGEDGADHERFGTGMMGSRCGATAGDNDTAGCGLGGSPRLEAYGAVELHDAPEDGIAPHCTSTALGSKRPSATYLPRV
jgi:hypothetical protein